MDNVDNFCGNEKSLESIGFFYKSGNQMLSTNVKKISTVMRLLKKLHTVDNVDNLLSEEVFADF